MAISTDDPAGESDLRFALRELSVGRDGDEYIVGRSDLGVYVAIPRPGGVLIEALRDGDSMAVASGRASAAAGEDVDVADFLAGLGAAGLLDTPSGIGAGSPAAARTGLVESLPRAVVQPLFGRVAWVFYVAAAVTAVIILLRRPDLRPIFDDVWFLTDPIWSILAVYVISVVITAGHESWHRLAGRALGVPARFRVSRRGIFVVFETDLSGLVTLPRRARYSPLLAGMAFDVVLLATALVLRLGFREEILGLPPALDRFLGAVIFRQFIVLIWQLAGVAFRSDSYAILATALGCHNLFRTTALTLKCRLRGLDTTEADELADMSARDRSVARWFWLVYLAGGVFMFEITVKYLFPFTYGMIGWVVPNITSLALDTLVFWESLALVAVLLAQIALIPLIALRERRHGLSSPPVAAASSPRRPVRSGYSRAWQAAFVAFVAFAAVQTVGAANGYFFASFDATGDNIAIAAFDDSCLPGRAVPIMDFPHVSQRDAGSVVYNSNPPTSGPHYAAALAPGIYRSALAKGQIVHAMEHGRVVIHYAPDTPAAVVSDLENIAKRYARDTVVAPNPTIHTEIALTSWGRIEKLKTYNEARIVRFVDLLHGRYDHDWTLDPNECRLGS